MVKGLPLSKGGCPFLPLEKESKSIYMHIYAHSISIRSSHVRLRLVASLSLCHSLGRPSLFLQRRNTWGVESSRAHNVYPSNIVGMNPDVSSGIKQSFATFYFVRQQFAAFLICRFSSSWLLGESVCSRSRSAKHQSSTNQPTKPSAKRQASSTKHHARSGSWRVSESAWTATTERYQWGCGCGVGWLP